MDFEGTLAALYTQLRTGQISDAQLESEVSALLRRERVRLSSKYPYPAVPSDRKATPTEENLLRLAEQAKRYTELQEGRARLYADNHKRFVEALTRRRKIMKDTWS